MASLTGTATIKASIEAVLANALDLSTAKDTISVTGQLSLTNGSGASQANEIFTDQRSLAASGTENLDLANASNPLVNAFGAPLNLARVKALLIINVSATAEIQIEPSVSSGWAAAFADAVVIPAGGVFLISAPTAAGYAVTGGSADSILVTNNDGSNSATYKIVIVGATS